MTPLRLDELAPRHREIVALAGQGYTDKEIALKLDIGEATVRTYWNRLRVRFGARSRTEVVALLFRASAEPDPFSFDYRLLDAMPHFVWVADPSGDVLFCNKWFGLYSGLPSQQIASAGCRALMPKEELGAAAERWRAAQDYGQAYEATVRLYCSLTRDWQFHRLRLCPIFESANRIVKWVGTAHELFPQTSLKSLMPSEGGPT
jgi:DNA-binding CsgD family transcriptional regulator